MPINAVHEEPIIPAQSIMNVAVRVDQSAGEVEAVIHEAVNASGQVMKAITDNVSSVEDILKQLQKIEHVIEDIREISGMTNLLALNAAIQSARAGEHGKGFAVVADEVRKLANRVKEATEAVSTTISIIGRHGQTIQAKNSTAQEESKSVQDVVRRLTAKANSLRVLSTLVQFEATEETHHEFVEKAVQESEKGASDISPADLPLPMDHHQCRLGKWYDGVGRDRFGAIAGFQDLAVPHQRIHQLAVDLLEANRRQSPDVAIIRDELKTQHRAFNKALDTMRKTLTTGELEGVSANV